MFATISGSLGLPGSASLHPDWSYVKLYKGAGTRWVYQDLPHCSWTQGYETLTVCTSTGTWCLGDVNLECGGQVSQSGMLGPGAHVAGSSIICLTGLLA